MGPCFDGGSNAFVMDSELGAHTRAILSCIPYSIHTYIYLSININVILECIMKLHTLVHNYWPFRDHGIYCGTLGSLGAGWRLMGLPRKPLGSL